MAGEKHRQKDQKIEPVEMEMVVGGQGPASLQQVWNCSPDACSIISTWFEHKVQPRLLLQRLSESTLDLVIEEKCWKSPHSAGLVLHWRIC
jgi:hypothetical protein